MIHGSKYRSLKNSTSVAQSDSILDIERKEMKEQHLLKIHNFGFADIHLENSGVISID